MGNGLDRIYEGLNLNDENRVMIATIGLYEHDRIRFAISERPVQHIVLLHSSAEPSKEAANQVVREYGSRKVTLHEVDPWDYNALLVKALEIPEEFPNHISEYHVGLGTRVMTLALAKAAHFLDYNAFMVIEDEDKTMRELQKIKQLPHNTLSSQKKLILKVMKRHGDWFDSIRHIIREVKAYIDEPPDDDIIRNEISKYHTHIGHLEDYGFVKTEKRGRRRAAKITSLGESILTLKRTRKKIWKN